MIEIIQPLIDEGQSTEQILAAMNALTVRKTDTTHKTGVDIKLALGSATKTGEALAVLTAIANGSVPLPEGMSETVRLVVRQELDQLAGAGLSLADEGLNQFLRMVGLVEIAEMGIWFVSPWKDAGNEGEMTEADLQAILVADARVRLMDRSINASALLQESIEKSDPSTFDAVAVWADLWSKTK